MCVHCKWDFDKNQWVWKLQCVTDKNVFPEKTIMDMVKQYTRENCGDETEVTLMLYSECRWGKRIFRAHDYYRGETAWYNWVMIKWECEHPEDVRED